MINNFTTLEICGYDMMQDLSSVENVAICSSEELEKDELENGILQCLIKDKLIKTASGGYAINKTIIEGKSSKQLFMKQLNERRKNSLPDGCYEKVNGQWEPRKFRK